MIFYTSICKDANPYQTVCLKVVISSYKFYVSRDCGDVGRNVCCDNISTHLIHHVWLHPGFWNPSAVGSRQRQEALRGLPAHPQCQWETLSQRSRAEGIRAGYRTSSPGFLWAPHTRMWAPHNHMHVNTHKPHVQLLKINFVRFTFIFNYV